MKVKQISDNQIVIITDKKEVVISLRNKKDRKKVKLQLR
ncbi:MAG: hypothetical protein Q606_CBAC00005G0008 [Intestinibacter bartlettii DORA_8_9]|jgi:hypothetical protein|nr:MAG: hypothetical protein Q606_CBAC00005G0008 [Intestinibacter bartlettii DORA_8_9]